MPRSKAERDGEAAAVGEPEIPLHRFLGIEVGPAAADGHVRLRLPYRPAWRVSVEPAPMLHGGLSALLLDAAANMAVMAATGRDVSTVDLRVDYLRAAPPGDLDAEGWVVRTGRVLAVADAAVTDAGGAVVAVGRGTFRLF